MNNIELLLKSRLEQLETIRPHIQPQTYQNILAKLAAERADIRQQLLDKEIAAEKEAAPQRLPKAFFEEKEMRPKGIRID